MAELDLTIPATRELLDGWCGPVQVDPFGISGLKPSWNLAAGGSALDGWILLGGPRLHAWPVTDETVAHVRLDLARAEVRDRVCRVGWGWPGMPRIVAREVATTTCPHPERDADWRLSVVLNISEAEIVQDGPIAGLDPDDETRLPDGSRRVDLEALRIAWLALQEQR